MTAGRPRKEETEDPRSVQQRNREMMLRMNISVSANRLLEARAATIIALAQLFPVGSRITKVNEDADTSFCYRVTGHKVLEDGRVYVLAEVVVDHYIHDTARHFQPEEVMTPQEYRDWRFINGPAAH